MNYIIRPLVMVLGIGLAACVNQRQENLSEFYPVSYQVLQGWDKEDYLGVLTVFRQTCQKMVGMPGETGLGGVSGLPGGKAKDWFPVCLAMRQVRLDQPLMARQFLEQWLQPYQYSTTMKTGKVTGYYEPEISGSLTWTEEYRIPVYMRPGDLVARETTDRQVQYGRMENGMFVPYYSRAQINRGALKNKRLEIVWLKNPADLFFMQIQGSGRIMLPDRKILRLGYAGKNGQPYTPLGKILIDKGYMNPDSVNIYSLRAWLMDHSDQALSVMEENQNYVFFKIINARVLDEGPQGAFGVSLSAGRSVAIDKKWIPLGVPLWLETTVPTNDGQVRKPWRHMVFAHDLGGDIHGINRVDLFTGWGKTAEWYAGLMNERGRVYLLLPRSVSASQAYSASVPVH